MSTKIAVFGLGKLGCTMAACFASKGSQVVGYDILQESVDKINRGESPIYEPGVVDLIKNHRINLRATCDPCDALKNTDIVHIIVPTPSMKNGSFSTQFVEDAILSIGRFMRKTANDKYRVIVITSTVLPGDTLRMQKLLEDRSGKFCGKDFGMCYNPDFIALGNIIHDFTNPDMILIGESDSKAGSILEQSHRQLVDNDPHIHHMNYYNAELSKIALNSYCTMKITFANVLAEICENMPDGDALVVAKALGTDTRISPKYLLPGLSYGGPCFPRDNRAFVNTAGRYGVKYTLAGMVDQINGFHKIHRVPEMLLNLLLKYESNTLSILGTTYKEKSTLVEESPAIEVARQLSRREIMIRVYDPSGMEETRRALESSPSAKVVLCESAKECIQDSGVCFIATPWEEFRNIDSDFFIGGMRTPVVVDAWGVCENTEGLIYKRIGRSDLE